MTDFIEKTLKVKIEFVEPVLGAVPRDKELYTNFIAANAPDEAGAEEEIKKLTRNELIDRRTSCFLMDEDGQPLLSNHVIKGLFKEAGKSIRRIPGKKYESQKLSLYRTKIDTLIFIYPRFIRLETPVDVDDCIEEFQRPCRAQTPQGERITLRNSEKLPEGTTAEFEVQMMDKSLEPAIREWLDYGSFHGIGEWRNADYGRFEWMEIK